MATRTDLTSYLKPLKAGSPKFGAWFDSGDYTIASDFGTTPSGQSRLLDGLRIQPSSALAFYAPFNGLMEFATAHTRRMDYTVGNEPRGETVADPVLRGLRHIDGSPFRIPSGQHMMLFTAFPHAYVRLKWLFREWEGGSDEKKLPRRPVPYRFAIVLPTNQVRASFHTQLETLLKGVWGSLLDTLKMIKIPIGSTTNLMPPAYFGDVSASPKLVKPTPRYYAPVGAQLMETRAAFNLYVFDEHGWPIDPVYVWFAFEQIAAKFKGVQEGETESENPLKKSDQQQTGRIRASNKRLFLHTVDLHGGTAPHYLAGALKVTADGYTLDSARTAPLRRVELSDPPSDSKRAEATIEFDTGSSGLNLSESQSKVALGLTPHGVLYESDGSEKLKHQALDYDFLRLVLVDLTQHVARNTPAASQRTAKEAFPKSQTVREHKKETKVTFLQDGKSIAGAINERLNITASSTTELRVTAMSPQIDPHLHLAGYHGGLKKTGAWTATHQANLEEIEKKLECRAIRPEKHQVLVAPEDTFPEGALVRIYPRVIDLETGEVVRGNGATAVVLSQTGTTPSQSTQGHLLIPLPNPGQWFKSISFDILVLTQSGDAPELHFRAGIEMENLPTSLPDPAEETFEFSQVSLTYDAAKGQAVLTFPKRVVAKAATILLVYPRLGKVVTETLKPDEEKKLTLPDLDGGDVVYLGVQQSSTAKFHEVELWQAYAASDLLIDKGVPLASDTILYKLREIGKGWTSNKDSTAKKMLVLVNERGIDAKSDPSGRQRAQQELKQALTDDKFVVDGRMYLTMTREESVFYVHTKTSSVTKQTAVLSGTPFLSRTVDTRAGRLGSPDAPAGPDLSVVGVSLDGRASHLVYKAFQARAQKKLNFGDNDKHPEAAPTDDGVKKSTHRAALLRTFPPKLDADSVNDFNPRGRRDQLEAVADAIRHAHRSIYIEGPYFEVYDRLVRRANTSAFQKDKYNLAQLIHERLLANPDLQVIICLPRRIRHPWGPVVEATLYEARARAVRTARYDGFEAKYKTPHHPQPTGDNPLPKLFPDALLAHERVLVFHPLGFMGRPLDLPTSIVVVDDAWASVGNSGFRRRSLSFDAGLNVAVTDLKLVEGAPSLVRQLRQKRMARLLHLDQRDDARVRRFEDAFNTVRGLCERRVALNVLDYDEAWTHLKNPKQKMDWREAIDPDGTRMAASYDAVLNWLYLPLKSLGVLDHFRDIELTWKVPDVSELTAQETPYVVRIRRDQAGAPVSEMTVKLKPTNRQIKQSVRLEKKATYEVEVRSTLTAGTTYQVTGKCGENATSLDLGEMTQAQ